MNYEDQIMDMVGNTVIVSLEPDESMFGMSVTGVLKLINQPLRGGQPDERVVMFAIETGRALESGSAWVYFSSDDVLNVGVQAIISHTNRRSSQQLDAIKVGQA